MTKDQLQQELKEKVKAGVKPSDLKKLKKSKSADDIIGATSSNPSLPRSKSSLEIPLPPPSLKQQVSALQDELTTERKKVSLLREDLANSQVKLKELADHLLQLRLDKIKDFADYLDKKQALETELEQNIQAGTQEIEKLETKLKTVSQQKQQLQTQLTNQLNGPQSLPTHFNYWPVVLTVCLALWLLKK